MRTARSTANGRTGSIGPDHYAIHPLQTGRICGHHRSNGCAGGGLTACGGGGSDDTIRALVATDQSLTTEFNTPVVVNLLANATSPNVGGVLALVGTPTVSNGTFTQAGNTLTVTPTTGFVGNMVVRYVVGDGKADNANGTVTITVKAAAEIGAPTITLKGVSPLTLTQGDPYTEAGATWTDAKDGTGADTTITGSVNTAVIGVYTLTYSKTNAAGKVGSATRTVLVVAKAPVPDTIAPIVTLNGAASVSLTVGGTYTEQGATWTDAVDGSGTVSDITGTVNTSAVGSYTRTYRKTDAAGNTGSATRTVLVTAAPDTTPPVITLVGAASVSLTVGGTYTEQGATWTDAVDGSGTVTDITGSVNTAVVGSYTRTYRKTDVAGNTGSATRTVTVTAAPDTTPPVITLNGASSISLTVGDSYTEQGATWSDAVDGSGTVTDITGSVNTAAVGSYTRTYRKTDAAGNTGSATRTVLVNAAPDPMPTGPALANVTVGDNGGGGPITPVNAGGATDPLGRAITYTATGLPAGLGINGGTGVISGIYDANGTETFSVTVRATPAGGSHPLIRSFTLTIIDNG